MRLHALGGACGLFGKPERKRPLGRPKCRWTDNIKNDLKIIRWEGVDLIWSRYWDKWRAVMNRVMNIRFHGNFLLAEDTVTSQ